MALTIAFSGSVNDRTATEILFKDTTGAYNVTTNPGGYGVTNNFLTPSVAFLRTKYWTATAWTNKFLTAANITSLTSANGLTRTPVELGLTGDTFSDGIYQFQYVPLNNTGVNGTFTNGSKTVTLSAATWDPATYGTALLAFVAGINSVGSPDAIATDILEVDWTGTMSTAQITLKETYTGTTQTVQLWFGPYKDIKVLNNKAGEACIAKTLAEGTIVDCGCASNSDSVTKMIQWRFTADVLFDCADYTGAHNTLVQLNRVCNPLSCFC